VKRGGGGRAGGFIGRAFSPRVPWRAVHAISHQPTAIAYHFRVGIWGLRGDDGGGDFVVGVKVEGQRREARAKARASVLFDVRFAARVKACP